VCHFSGLCDCIVVRSIIPISVGMKGFEAFCVEISDPC
jgi:hypothetical protein